jgi:predicted dienelactone hydrolase
MLLARRSPIAVSLLALVLAGCSGGGGETKPDHDAGTGGGDAGSDAGPPLDPTTFGVNDAGPFTCGHRQLTVTYTPPAGQPAREIPVHFWYPSTSTDGEHARYKGIFVDDYAWEDGALAPPAWKEGYPVLLHSHGHMGFAGNSARLMCHFASHGWLAVAPEHVGNTLTDTPDPRPLALYYERPLDMRAALDLVSKLPDGDPLAGKADFGHLGVSGHSFGTYTAWAQGGATYDIDAIKTACASGDPGSCDDPGIAVFSTDLSEMRAKAIIPMAGGQHEFFGTNGLDTARVPVLLMTGSLDQVGADTLFANISGVDLTWADVEGGCHQLYGLGNSVKGGPECMALGDEEGFAIVNPYILAFARYHVLGERGDEVKGLVEGTKGLSPKMHRQHKGP